MRSWASRGRILLRNRVAAFESLLFAARRQATLANVHTRGAAAPRNVCDVAGKPRLRACDRRWPPSIWRFLVRGSLAAAALAAIGASRSSSHTAYLFHPESRLSTTRTDLESQLTLVPTDHIRAVIGLGARSERVESETFLGGKEKTGSWRAFGNAEYKFAPPLRLHLGGFYENDSIIGSTFSPRAALTYDLTPHQTLRVVMARGTRTPDLREQRTDWTYTATDFNPPLNGLQRRALLPKRPVNPDLGQGRDSKSRGRLLDQHSRRRT